MPKQFVKTYSFFENQGLKPNEVCVLSHLADRMESSMKRDKYFDKDEHANFVIYTQQQLGAQINLSAKAVGNIYDRLEEKGWIKRVAIKGVSYKRIFLPRYTPADFPYFFNLHLAEETSGTPWKKLPLNQTLIIQTNQKSCNTVNTGEPARMTKSQSSKPKQETKTFKATSEITRWQNATHAELGFPEKAVEQIARFVKNDVKQARSIVEKIVIARNKVVSDNKLPKTPMIKFESNGNIQSLLPGTLTRIFSYIQAKGFKIYDGYLVKSCKKFFKAAFGLEADVPNQTPTMPKAQHNGQARVVETKPDWAKEGYVAPQVDQPTAIEKEAVDRDLAQLALNKMRHETPDYLEQFKHADMLDIYAQLKTDLNVQPAVLTQAVKLVQTGFSNVDQPTSSETTFQPKSVQPEPEMASVESAEVAQVNSELADIALNKAFREDPQYLKSFKDTNAVSIQAKLATDLAVKHAAVLKQAVKKIQAKLMGISTPVLGI